MLRGLRIELDSDDPGAWKLFLDQLSGCAAAAADVQHDAGRLIEKTRDLDARVQVICRVEWQVITEVRLPDIAHRCLKSRRLYCREWPTLAPAVISIICALSTPMRPSQTALNRWL